jgi:aryl-alcohol dehydrogenase-like predicted oxidoreductase
MAATSARLFVRLATIQAALEAGINFLNTGDFYGMKHNELLVGQAIKGRRDQALISVKFGALRSPSGQMLGVDLPKNLERVSFLRARKTVRRRNWQ